MKNRFEEMLLPTVLVAFASLLACSSDQANSEARVCIPGEQRACACAGSNLRQGVQVCNEEGTALGTCTGCESASQGGNPGSVSATDSWSATTAQSIGGSGVGGAIMGGTATSSGSGASSVTTAGRSNCAPFASTYDPDFKAEELFVAQARLDCDNLVRCCLMPASMHDDCVKVWSSYGNDTANRIRAGLLTVDLSNDKACFDARAAQTGCNDPTPVVCQQLRSVFAPARHVGESCREQGDCIDSYCDTSSNACGGLCVAYAKLGEVCVPGRVSCGPGLYCGADPNSPQPETSAEGDPEPTPVQRVCLERLQAGVPCESESCADNLYCTGEEGSRICAPPLPSGAPCDREHDRCEIGLYCNGTCTSARRNVPLGEPCTDAAECGSGSYCHFGSTSKSEGRCVPTLPIGARCIRESGECGDDARCNGSSKAGTCEIPRGIGEPCNSEYDCYWAFGCSEEGKCAQFAKLGEYCDAMIECVDSICDDESVELPQCKPRLVEGESCLYNRECESQWCVDFACCGQ